MVTRLSLIEARGQLYPPAGRVLRRYTTTSCCTTIHLPLEWHRPPTGPVTRRDGWAREEGREGRREGRGEGREGGKMEQSSGAKVLVLSGVKRPHWLRCSCGWSEGGVEEGGRVTGNFTTHILAARDTYLLGADCTRDTPSPVATQHGLGCKPFSTGTHYYLEFGTIMEFEIKEEEEEKEGEKRKREPREEAPARPSPQYFEVTQGTPSKPPFTHLSRRAAHRRPSLRGSARLDAFM
ncbi:hypothetical protein E2C01_028601 [Portunus trituberculatus]|uniref:Uncharacterized protein n=1 Tax=Portunus trituberculatus TaxID=210409 RepID=A0A5B7EQF0_PORTR|nr:hypothetical protein [Portunus trituberculatus]